MSTTSYSQIQLQEDYKEKMILQEEKDDFTYPTTTVTVSDASSESSSVNGQQETTGGRVLEFPMKLHRLLDDAEQDKIDRTIVSWLPCGQAFEIHNKVQFETKIMKKYFKASSYKSFHRNLNLWGFETVRKGVYKGAKFNHMFVRGDPDRCYNMKRTRIKKNSKFMEKTACTKTTPPIGEGIPVNPPRRSSSITSSPMITSRPMSDGSLASSAAVAAAASSAMSREIMSKLLILNKLDADLAAQHRAVQSPQLGLSPLLPVQPLTSDLLREGTVSPSAQSFTSSTIMNHHNTGADVASNLIRVAVLDLLLHRGL